MAQVIELAPQPEGDYLREASALYDRNELDAAYAIVDKRLMHEPEDAQALVLMSAILRASNRVSLAYPIAKRATELRPDRPETWNAFAHAAQHLWRMEESQQNYRKALQRAKSKQQRALYLNNLGSVFVDLGQFAQAAPLFRESLELEPTDVQARHNLGLCLLSAREWEEGWKYYSASVGTLNRRIVKYRREEEPTWDGTADKTVVIYGEQGLGDEICAASMLPDAIRDCRKVIVDCDKRLEGLFRRSFPEASVYGTRWAKPGDARWNESAEEIDASIAGFEIGQFYRKADADFPGTAYLKPDPDRVAMWKGLFQGKGKPTIGIAWSGGTWMNAGKYRQLPLAEWRPIFEAVDAQWVSLQYKDAREEIAAFHVEQKVDLKQYPYGTLTKDYDDTAALVAACDLVIAVQTSVNHLAGALGVPAWCLLPKTSQWRYGEQGDSLPWYKSLKLYRQSDKWPIKKVADDLRTHLA